MMPGTGRSLPIRFPWLDENQNHFRTPTIVFQLVGYLTEGNVTTVASSTLLPAVHFPHP